MDLHTDTLLSFLIASGMDQASDHRIYKPVPNGVLAIWGLLRVLVHGWGLIVTPFFALCRAGHKHWLGQSGWLVCHHAGEKDEVLKWHDIVQSLFSSTEDCGHTYGLYKQQRTQQVQTYWMLNICCGPLRLFWLKKALRSVYYFVWESQSGFWNVLLHVGSLHSRSDIFCYAKHGTDHVSYLWIKKNDSIRGALWECSVWLHPWE